MNELQVFNYDSKEVRTVIIDGEPFWIAKDVCDILGYSNVSQTLTDNCKAKGISARYTPVMTEGGVQEVRIIPESDLFRLIIKSKLPAADKFENWVFEEVLPSIRKTGTYSVNIPQTFAEALRLAADQAEQIEVMKPKAIEYDKFIDSDSLLDVGAVAKLFGIGRNNFFKMLRDHKILMSDNEPYQDYVKYFEIKVKPVPMGNKIENKTVTFFKPAGISYISKRFKLNEVE